MEFSSSYGLGTGICPVYQKWLFLRCFSVDSCKLYWLVLALLTVVSFGIMSRMRRQFQFWHSRVFCGRIVNIFIFCFGTSVDPAKTGNHFYFYKNETRRLQRYFYERRSYFLRYSYVNKEQIWSKLCANVNRYTILRANYRLKCNLRWLELGILFLFIIVR